MVLKYFDEVYFEDLWDNIDSNFKYYLTSNSWVDEVFKDNTYFLESNLNYNKIELTDNEAENAIKVYEALHDLSLAQASSPLLWSYLAHVDFYDYMHKRWDISGENITKDISTKIKERYFCKKTRRGLLRNGISRLWWATYLSIDNKSQDIYKYTKILFSDEDLFLGLMERDYSGCKNILLGVLKAFDVYKSKNGKLPSRECRRSLYVYLNQCGAASLLDSLKEEYVTTMSLEFIINFINTNRTH